MKILPVLAALVLATPALAHDAVKPEHARPRKTVVTAPVAVPMSKEAERPTIQVTIDGKGPYTFLVDTGAGSTVINADLAEELGLKKVGETRLGDPMNPEAIKANVVKVKSLSIGGATFQDFEAASWDRGYLLERQKDGPRGVIGFPVFTDVLVTFDYAEHELRIARGDLPAADGKAVLAYTDPMGIPEFTTSLGGVDVATHLDTGSGGFFSVPKKYQDRLKFTEPLAEVGRARTVNTEMVLKGAQLDGDLAIGGFRYEKPFVIVSDELPMGNLGGRALAPFAITFDQRAKTMRFEQKAPLVSEQPRARATTTNASAAGPGSGLKFAAHGAGDLEVFAVEPGSPAAKLGVTAGEKVLAVNGVPFASLPEDAIRAALHVSPLKLKLEKDGVAHEVTIAF